MGDASNESQTFGSNPNPPKAGGTSPSTVSPPGASEVQNRPEQYRNPETSAFQHGGQPSFQIHPQQQFGSPYQTRQNLSTPLQTNPTISLANTAQVQLSGRGSSFNVAPLNAAFPESPNFGQGFVQQSSQTFPSEPSQAAIIYRLQSGSQFLGHIAMAQPNNPVHIIQYPQQYQGKYAQQTPSLQQSSLSPSQQFATNQAFLSPLQPQQIYPSYYQPETSQYGLQAQRYSTNQPQSHGASYGGRINLEAGFSSQQQKGENLGGQATQSGGSLAKLSGSASIGSQTTALRGPPRKPKQSGHALWVGNLPPGANVVDLKDHFSRDATNDILSVFLISKSNCAFVNYKTEKSCAAAMTRFHDGRFQGVRLVCRLRRSQVNTTTGVPTGPGAVSSSQQTVVQLVSESENVTRERGSITESKENSPGIPLTKDKFFIVKSLTVEDLELSVINGMWATQSHNEQALNEAYEIAENVYLIFSANKSGEYFGYARMISRINDDPAAVVELAPKAQAAMDSDLSKAIPTSATEFAPKGHIINDAARGTIFWEAEHDEDDGSGECEEQRSDHSDQELEGNMPTKAWGKPFKVEWLCTNRLPFYRTKGLRNPWNSNREVKIARDGTELETSVGRRLIQMFHQEPSSTVSTMPATMTPMMSGYPQMWPY